MKRCQIDQPARSNWIQRGHVMSRNFGKVARTWRQEVKLGCRKGYAPPGDVAASMGLRDFSKSIDEPCADLPAHTPVPGATAPAALATAATPASLARAAGDPNRTKADGD
ncbi:hypothetical protein A9Q94_02010 [Rhodobacterales bacterium 56_14_T64]|nr:hypothetical protein A9Q94_02010 [Rhodobacterales bacterium 56_14_T64]